MEDEKLEHTMSGFNAYEAFINKIPESSLSELNHIVNRLRSQKHTEEILSFIDKLHEHLFDSPDAHALDISEYSDTILFQLYRYYREYGYTGSLADMLLSLEKQVEVGTHEDMVGGYSTTKAVNVVEWQWRFNYHMRDQNAHKELLDVFRPQYVLNLSPILAVDYRFNDDLEEVSLPIPYWNEPDGTVNIESCSDRNVPIVADLIRIEDEEHSVRVRLSTEDKRVVYDYMYDDAIVGSTEITALSPSTAINRISITYNTKRFSFKDFFKVHLVDRPDYTFIPTRVCSELPLVKSGNSLRSLAIYRQGITVSEQNDFLN